MPTYPTRTPSAFDRTNCFIPLVTAALTERGIYDTLTGFIRETYGEDVLTSVLSKWHEETPKMPRDNEVHEFKNSAVISVAHAYVYMYQFMEPESKAMELQAIAEEYFGAPMFRLAVGRILGPWGGYWFGTPKD
jgi:hypothetical protein